jgi:hypothetical protein
MTHTGTSYAQVRPRSRSRVSRRGVGLSALAVVMFALALLAPSSSFALSEGRVYEMVSPVYKAGYQATLEDVAPNGETVIFQSVGGFAGNPDDNYLRNYYVAHRGGSQWTTAAVTPPAALLPKAAVEDFSPTLRSSVTLGQPGPNEGFAFTEDEESEFLLHDLTLPDEAANFPLAGEVLKAVVPSPTHAYGATYVGSSASLSHIVLATREGTALLEEAVKTSSNPPGFGRTSAALYDLTSAGGAEPLRLIELDNRHNLLNHDCESSLGAGYGRHSQYNAVSADGEEIFFTLGISDPNTSVECPEHAQLFMRVGGARTVEISRPLERSKQYGGCVGEVGEASGEVPCKGAVSRAPAEFQGASESGDRVFFTTSSPLVVSDADNGDDLYMATIGCPGGEGETCEASEREVTSLVQASHGVESAEVQNVVAVAPDGSHVYFVARGALTDEPGPEGRVPLEGADNLYVYTVNPGTSGGPSTSGEISFISDLCSGPGESGVVHDVQCPSNLDRMAGANGRNDMLLWQNSLDREAQVNDCVEPEASCETGRFLLFSSYAQLTVSDTDAAKDVYRYDALTGVLDRVSIGEAGSSENGNDDLFDATIPQASESNNFEGSLAAQHDLNSRAITQDGSRVVFMTAEPLSSAATTGVVNAYEWHEQLGQSEGRVSLISSGSSPVNQVLISSSGRDVFFDTAQGLVRQDSDGEIDVYDARIGGGFPLPPAEPEPCAGDACRGPLTNPSPLLVPGSVVQAPGGNFAVPAKVVVKSKSKTKLKPKKVKAKGKGKRARRARLSAGTARGRGRR